MTIDQVQSGYVRRRAGWRAAYLNSLTPSVHVSFWARSWNMFVITLSALRVAVVTVTPVALVVLAGVLTYKEVVTSSINVSVVAVPDDLVKKGFTTVAATELVRSELAQIQSGAQISMKKASLWPEDNVLQFSIPGTGLSIHGVAAWIKQMIGNEDPTVIVYLSRSGDKLLVTLSFGAARVTLPSLGTPIYATDETVAISAAAQEIARRTQPLIFASYLYESQQPEACVRVIRAIRAVFPLKSESSAQAFNLLGLIERDQRNFTQALTHFDEAINSDPRAFYAYYNKANALRDQHRLNDAIAQFKEAIKYGKGFAPAYLGMANTLFDKGQWQQAVDYYRHAIDIDPSDSYAQNGLGNALVKLRKLDEAIDAYTHAIDRNPMNAYPYNGLGNTLQDKGSFKEAILNYNTAIELDQNYSRPYIGLGNIYRKQNKMSDAINAYRTAIDKEPGFTVAYFGLAEALFDRGREDRARYYNRLGRQIDRLARN